MSEWQRHRMQALWALLTNSYLIGFVTGKIYKGKLKNLCVPDMNCCSCPGALQAVIGQGSPYFCKLICLVGTLEGGLPLVLLNESMHRAVGFLYLWKNVILAVTIFLSILIYRPFCKYICPLGAIYSLFNPISIFSYWLDREKCIKCGACKIQVDPVANCNRPECIRWGQCKKACPTGAITNGFFERYRKAEAAEPQKSWAARRHQ